MRVADPLEYLLVMFERACPESPGEDDHVGPGEVGEGAVRGDAQHPVVTSDLAPPVADEGEVDGWDPLQDLVGSDGVEGGESGEEGDDDLQVGGHAFTFRSATTRKRRR